MLKLVNLKKDYNLNNEKVHALKGINITFRKNEFVSILGQSGCGKTTLLNIIGGLDKATSGDLIINGISTKKYKDKDFDTYRNHKIGFVFQAYNLINHLTVLDNVELSLTLSGMPKKERREKAIKALTKVGLKDQIYKKPSQMSGGQTQRVAIARALVNNPEIILLDEPTGALDSKTSIEIMELLKKIAKDKLIIMVTHNPKLAETYSSRIVKLLDGLIIEDTNPYEEKGEKVQKEDKQKPSMNFLAALKLSLNNLLTKKGRTILTAFAGSIGIIGIALILSLSNGVQKYIDNIEEETLSSYPITLEKESVDFTSMLSEMMKITENKNQKETNKIISRNLMNDMLSTMTGEKTTNNLEKFKKHIESTKELKENTINIQYGYSLKINTYTKNIKNKMVKTNPSTLMDELNLNEAMKWREKFMPETDTTTNDVWHELYTSKELLNSKYQLIKGKMPTKYNEIVLVIDKENQITDYTLYQLGYLDSKELVENMNKMLKGETIETKTSQKYTYEDFLGKKFKLVLNTDYYIKQGGIWIDKQDDEDYINKMLKDKEDLEIVGIIKSKDANSPFPYGGIGYTKNLTNYVIDKIKKQEIVQEQLNNKEINIFTKAPFTKEEFSLNNLTKEQQMYFSTLSDEEKISIYEKYKEYNKATYETNLETLGYVDLESPSSISLYAKDFDSKEKITDLINDYNKKEKEQGQKENIIEYTDIVGLMMTSVKKVVNMISYVLIAFVAVSLVVSSIMIGIITYISVLERTKEIGILRSIGASKKDITRVFNAETFIIGLTSGTIGILITLLITIPTSIIVENKTGIPNITTLPPQGAIILIIISMILTIIAGLIPSKIASKKDPVEALRSE